MMLHDIDVDDVALLTPHRSCNPPVAHIRLPAMENKHGWKMQVPAMSFLLLSCLSFTNNISIIITSGMQ